MRRWVLLVAVVLALALFAAQRLGRLASPAPDATSVHGRTAAPVEDAARWPPGEVAPNLELLALDGRTTVRLLDRGANRPLILIVAATGSPALDRCASRWRELFEIYKDRVEFLTLFVAAPDSGGAVPTALTFVQCNDWRIPVLVDGAGGAAAAAFGAAPQVAILMDEGRRRLGSPVVAESPADLDAVNAWLRHRFAP